MRPAPLRCEATHPGACRLFFTGRKSRDSLRDRRRRRVDVQARLLLLVALVTDLFALPMVGMPREMTQPHPEALGQACAGAFQAEGSLDLLKVCVREHTNDAGFQTQDL